MAMRPTDTPPQALMDTYAIQCDRLRDSFLEDARTRGRAMDDDGGDGMEEMYEADAKDAQEIAKILRLGAWTEAVYRVSRLDTAPREEYDFYYSDPRA